MSLEIPWLSVKYVCFKTHLKYLLRLQRRITIILKDLSLHGLLYSSLPCWMDAFVILHVLLVYYFRLTNNLR